MNPVPPSFLRCRLGEESVALPWANVRAIEGIDRLQRTPRPGPLSGWLLGEEYEAPVYDLSVLLGLPPIGPGAGASVVLLGGGAAPRGLLVEAADRAPIASTSALASRRLLARSGLGACVGVVALEGQLLPWLEPSRLHADLPSCGDCGGARGAGSCEESDPLLRPPAGVARAILTFGGAPGFAVSLSQVVEVVDPETPAPVHGASGFLLGLLAWRGRAIPLVDLAAFFGESSGGPGAPRRAVIARTLDPDDCIALAVFGEVKLRRLPAESRLVEPPADLASRAPGALLGCAEIDGDAVWIPDLERVLSALCEVDS